jgi:uncharacterized protein (DUF1330 family)
MPGYFILSQQVDDPERYGQEYAPEAMRFVEKYGGEVIAASFAAEALEGDPAPGIVVIKFPSVEDARTALTDPEYLPHKAFRHSITSRYSAVIVPHFEPPTT